MKAVIAVSGPDRWMLEFTQAIRWFDEQHEGCVFQVIGEHALPPTRSSCAEPSTAGRPDSRSSTRADSGSTATATR